MNKIILISLFLVFTNIIVGQEIKYDSTEINSKDYDIFYFEGGFNVSSFQELKSEIRQGYSFGLTLTKSFTNSIGLTIPILIKRENTYLNRRKGIYNEDYTCYRKYYDINMSYLYLELPFSLYYKIWGNKESAIYFSLGYGFSVIMGDRSKRTNYVLTDEIVIPYPCDYAPQGDFYDNENTASSGMSANAAVIITYWKVLFKVLYINKRYPITGFDKLHTFSFHLGYLLN